MQILWLHDNTTTAGMISGLKYICNDLGIASNQIIFVNIINSIKDAKLRKGQNKIIANPEHKASFHRRLDAFIKKIKPDVVVVNDDFSLEYLFNQASVSNCRGSLYYRKKLPFVVLDSYKIIHQVKWGLWLYLNDLQKLHRVGVGRMRTQLKFNYKICNNFDNLLQMERELARCSIIATDIETSHRLITFISYAGINDDGRLICWGVPFYNPLKPDFAHWENAEDEEEAWQVVQQINANPAIKVLQNGVYDSAYFLQNNVPLNNYLLDTQHMWHCIWVESRKSLDVISSVMLDHYSYWKHEIKGEATTRDKNERVPYTENGLNIYHRYGCLDSYYTLFDSIRLLQLFQQIPWARDNYNREFRDAIGPAFAMTMHGLKQHPFRAQHKINELKTTAQDKLITVRKLVDDPQFNPKSNPQYIELLYDILGAKPAKIRAAKGKAAGRSVDKKILKFVKRQHPVYKRVVDAITAYKEADVNVSKYGNPNLLYQGRLLYSLSCVTETERYASSSHHWWYGTNAQNIPKKIRDMYVADPGYVFFEPDYSQSDMWFVAAHSQDPTMIKNMLSPKDTHCVHASMFYNRDYEDVYQGHLKEEDWVENPLTGIRQQSKRFGHGANFRMKGKTLYVNMGHDEVIAAAVSMNIAGARTWNQNQCERFCENILKKYFDYYKTIPDWFEKSARECAENDGLAVSAYGYTRRFFGEILEDENIQRELSAFYGQAGTAGNIRRSALDIFYKSGLMDQGLQMILQNHDAFLFGIPVDRLDMCQKLLDIMLKPCTIKGWTFQVPVDAKIGLSWGKAMMPWNEFVTVEEIKSHDMAWELENYKEERKQLSV